MSLRLKPEMDCAQTDGVQNDQVDELRKLIDRYATICAGVAREECRPFERSRPDYMGRRQAREHINTALNQLLQPND